MIIKNEGQIDLHVERLVESDPEFRKLLNLKIKQFNDVTSPHHRAVRQHGISSFEFAVRDNTGELLGGLTGSTYWDWLEIDDLWLDERIRGQGAGSELLRLAELEGQARGARHVHLHTFSFQAKGFYEKAGYRVVGELSGYPPGASFYWMRKEL